MARLSGFHLEGGIGKTMPDLVYPVNSLYLTDELGDPRHRLGRFVGEADGRRTGCCARNGRLCRSGFNRRLEGSTGIAQMPSHTHEYYGYNSEAGTTTLRGSYPPWIAQDKKYNWDMDACRATGGEQTFSPAYLRQRLEEDGVAREASRG